MTYAGLSFFLFALFCAIDSVCIILIKYRLHFECWILFKWQSVDIFISSSGWIIFSFIFLFEVDYIEINKENVIEYRKLNEDFIEASIEITHAVKSL